MNLRKLFIISLVTLFSGCAVLASLNYDQLFGKPQVRERQAPLDSATAHFFLDQVKPIIDKRCVVCHACYDAPCQLKMSSVEGIDRGASKEKVYQGTRLTAASPTRLFEDAQRTKEWREFNFHPILNEREQSPNANLQAGLMARLLMQKEAHSLPKQTQLEGFDFSIDREEQCVAIEDYEQYQAQYPDWGMPFGMPNLAQSDYQTLMTWLENGAIMNAHLPLTKQQQSLVAQYEAFLNLITTNFKLTKESIMAILFTKEEAMKDLPF
ncbi:fatty acid cis/trans isomerase, partial [Vibrio cincinnatiensis]